MLTTPNRRRRFIANQSAAAARNLGQKTSAARNLWQEAATVRHLWQDATGALELWQGAADTRRCLLFLAEAVTPAVDKKRAEPPPLKVPVAHRPGVDMEKTGMRVPADAAALHPPGRLHRLFEPRFEMDVERAAIEMLAVIGDAKGGARQHRVGLGRPIGGKDGRALRVHRIHYR